MSEKVPDIVRWLESRTESLRMDYSLSLAERFVKYYRVEGNPAGFKGYEWQIAILNDLHPRQSIVKRSQVGMTLLAMAKIILLLEQYAIVPFYARDDDGEYMACHPTGIYTFENADKVHDFSSDRLKGFLNDNPFLQGLIEEGEVDQVRLKKFGRSSLYLGGRRNVQSVTSIPGNIVMADEWDRTSDFTIGEQLESRLKASKMFRAKSQRGLYIKYSTPEAYGVGVSQEYEDSDQMVFQVKCTRSFDGRNVVVVKSPDGQRLCMSMADLFDYVGGVVYFVAGSSVRYTPGWTVLDRSGWVDLHRVLRHELDEKMLCLSGRSTHILTTENHPTIVAKDTTYLCPVCGIPGRVTGTRRRYRSFSCECGNRWNSTRLNGCGGPSSRDIIKANGSLNRSVFCCRDVEIVDDACDIILPGWMIGMILTDGCLLRGSGKSGFNGFSIAQKCGTEIHNKILDTIDALSLKYRVDSDVQIRVFSSELAEYLLSAGIGVGSRNKRMPFNIFNKKFAFDVLAGIIDGDGTVSGRTCSIRVASYVLVNQIKWLLNIHGFRAAVNTIKRSCGSFDCDDPLQMYGVSFIIDDELVELLRESVKIRGITTKSSRQSNKISNDIDVIRSVTESTDIRDDYVYDITTSSGTFYANSTLVHNCNHWQEMLYPDSIFGHYEKGTEPQGELYYQCLKCQRPLDWSQIGRWDRSRPLKTENCEWVPRRLDYHNNVTRYGEGTRGYRVPWAYSAPVEEVMRDRDKKSKLYFFHHVLGEAFAEDSTGLMPDAFRSRIDTTFKFGDRKENMVYVMGVDQGCFVSIWGMIPFSREDGHQFGKWVLYYFENTPNEFAFTSWKAAGKETTVKRGRLYELMKEWKIDLAVIDAEPNLNDAHNFSREFEELIFVNHSTQMKNHDPSIGFTWVDYDTDQDDNEIFVGRISEDKVSALDAYFDFVREGNLAVAGGVDEEAFSRYIEQHTNIRKVIEEKGGSSIGLPSLISVYRAFGADHFGHSGKFAFQAAVLWHKFQRSTGHLIIPGGVSGWKMGKKNDVR